MIARTFTVKLSASDGNIVLSTLGALSADRAFDKWLRTRDAYDLIECANRVHAEVSPAAPAFPKLVPRKVERKARRGEQQESRAEVRRKVMARAAGRCEACGRRAVTVLDHWEGGSGRRQERESVETCWALCVERCNPARTENRPSAAHWNEERRKFCERVGLPFVAHIEKPLAVAARKPLTEKQATVLAFIAASVKDFGFPPTIRELGEHLGIGSTNGVNDHLAALERKGYIRRLPKGARGLSILPDPQQAAPKEEA